MKFGADGANGQDKKQTVIAIVAIVAILAAVGLLARNFMGGGGVPSSYPEPSSTQTMTPDAVQPRDMPPSTTPDGAEPSPATTPTAAPPPAPKPRGVSSQPAPAGPTRQLKIFGTVTVTYPANWKISAGGGNSFAVFTDGNAKFSVHPPDPKADSAKKIAELALKQITPGAVVTQEGTDRVMGREVYWFAVKYQGKVARVVGIDAPTRIVVVETVESGDFGKYRETFNKIQAGITFTGR